MKKLGFNSVLCSVSTNRNKISRCKTVEHRTCLASQGGLMCEATLETPRYPPLMYQLEVREYIIRCGI